MEFEDCLKYFVHYCISYGETRSHSNVGVGEHAGVSLLYGKPSKTKLTTAVKDHMLFWDHIVSLEDFKILGSGNSEVHFKVKESLLISRDKSVLNIYENFLSHCSFD